ncbi:hypothetical protein EG352_14000 [Chryseobacterium indologenes]|uniref:Uncharacterized protein n=2 Tax=Chryseobacterium indologenes TaxID=253 RepID=A0AAD0YTQ4_CHRID|nr:hypothetical protein [Chryseobacterium indologenes]AZB18814.1 hypothetical protein EG352_14000 [Chryseobacterium indologenes]
MFNGAVSGGVGSVLGGGNFWMGAGQGLIVTAFNFLAHKEITTVEETNTGGDCPTCPKNAKNWETYTEDYTIFDTKFWTWDNISNGRKSYYYLNGKWNEIKLITGDVPLGPNGPLKGMKALNELPALDATRKVHGILPKIKDLAKYSKDDLKILLKELKQSIPSRIKSTSLKGPNSSRLQNRQHGQRQGAEQDLIKSLEKFLRK